MKKEDAIKYLQQLYPNGGHCWLDEQRIEAIGMAVKALQEEPVSSVWKDARKSVPENSISQIICIKEDGLAIATEGRIVSGTIKWAYLSDLLNLDNSCNFEKNLQEEPAPKIFEDMLNAKTSAESLGISQEEHDRIVDECIYGKEPELVDADDLPKEEPASEIDFEQELYKAFGQVKDFTLGMRIAKWFYDMGKKNQEHVSEDLEEASRNYADNEEYGDDVYYSIKASFKVGAKWKKEHLWKPADGDDLPEIDREVIALLDNGKVGFAHRPPEYWDGKDIVTGKVTRNYPKIYDKGGWNIPNVKFWLDCEIPKEIEL